MAEQDNVERLLRDNNRIAKANNKLLHKILGHLRLTRAIRVIYWVVIIGSALGAYYFLQPFFDNVQNTYQNVTGAIRNVGEALPVVNNLIDDSPTEETAPEL